MAWAKRSLGFPAAARRSGVPGADRAPVRSAPTPAATTKATPTSDQALGTWPSSANPAIRASAGSRHIRVPNAAAVSRRSAYISRLNGTIGSSSARPRPASSRCGVSAGRMPGPVTSVDTRAATGMDTARPCRPATSSPTAWVRTM